MFVLVLVAVLWTGMHNADLPESAPHLRHGSIVKPKPAAQPDMEPVVWQQRRFHGLE